MLGSSQLCKHFPQIQETVDLPSCTRTPTDSQVRAPKFCPDKERWKRGYWLYWICKELPYKGRHRSICDIGYYLWFGDDSRGIPSLSGENNDEYRAHRIRLWFMSIDCDGSIDITRHGVDSDWLWYEILRACKYRGPNYGKNNEGEITTSSLVERGINPFQAKYANRIRERKARKRIEYQARKYVARSGSVPTICELSKISRSHFNTAKRVLVELLEELEQLAAQWHEKKEAPSTLAITPEVPVKPQPVKMTLIQSLLFDIGMGFETMKYNTA